MVPVVVCTPVMAALETVTAVGGVPVMSAEVWAMTPFGRA